MIKTSNIYYPTSAIEKCIINHIWRLSEYDMHKRKEVILPKGTVEIIFNFSNKIEYYNPSTQTLKRLPTVFINGINYKQFELIKTSHQEFLGIQLKSIALMILFGISAREFNDNVYEGKDICPYLNTLADKLHSEQSFSKQVETILQWIRSKIFTLDCNLLINRIQKLNKIISYPDISVKKLSEEICLSERQLRRFSAVWLGMNTEEFIHYNKYLKSLHLLHHPKSTLTQIGLEAGYYDQSHFIREFKSYTGLTPKQYIKAKKELPGHIFI